MAMGIKERFEVARKIFDRRPVKVAFVIWGVVATYDTVLSQFVPESLGRRFPKMHELIAATTGWLPWYIWLLLLAAIIAAASFEFAVRKSRPSKKSHPSVAKDTLVDNKSRELAGIVNALNEAALSWTFKLPLPPDDPWIQRYNQLKTSDHPIWTDPAINQLRRDFIQFCGIVADPIGGAPQHIADRNELTRIGRSLMAALKGEKLPTNPLELVFANDAESVHIKKGLYGPEAETYWLGVHNATSSTVYDVEVRALDSWFTRAGIVHAHTGRSTDSHSPFKIGEMRALNPDVTERVEIIGLGYHPASSNPDYIFNTVQRFTIEVSARDVPAIRREFEFDPKDRPMLRMLP